MSTVKSASSVPMATSPVQPVTTESKNYLIPTSALQVISRLIGLAGGYAAYTYNPGATLSGAAINAFINFLDTFHDEKEYVKEEILRERSFAVSAMNLTFTAVMLSRPGHSFLPFTLGMRGFGCLLRSVEAIANTVFSKAEKSA